MARALTPRGPDSEGFFGAGNVGLGVRRLAIVDVAGGDQPLTNEDGEVVVVCNGEIYNSPELRVRLSDRGHRFRTGSDCEVIVHAYEEYGDAFVKQLNGMFALALWDNRRQRMVLARDRMGIKPLYYTHDQGRLLFASEAKALLAYPGFRPRLDLVSLSHYLTYDYVPTPRSIFAGVKKLRPGHVLIVEDGLSREECYWELELTERRTSASVSDMADELWAALRESVAMELMSDVPLGVFLSGGIDSSSVAAAMTDLGAEVRTFSIGFRESSFDESSYSRRVAEYLGTRHEQLELEPELMPRLVPAVADFLDEPFADPSVIPTYLLSRFARQGVTVALGGDGGDELFGGYPMLQAHRLAGYYQRLPLPLRRSLIPGIASKLPVSHGNFNLEVKAKRFLSAADYPAAERHHLWLAAFSEEGKAALLQDEVLAELAKAAETHGPLQEHMSHCSGLAQLNQILYLDMKMYLEGDILPKVDRASMSCSLEVRVPLLNAKLLELMLHAPLNLKLRGLTRKYLLRRAVAGRLPKDIIKRPKKGFGIPVAAWLRSDLRPMLLEYLSPPRLASQGLFNSEYVARLIEDHLAQRKDNRKPLWTLLMFQLWHERYGVAP